MCVCTWTVEADIYNCFDIVGLDKWVVDGGYVEDKEDLPVSEMSFLQRGGIAKLSLGPLECYGSCKFPL